MKKRLKEKRGITLIVLIITVVVMLILAGVAIAAVIDGEGLFSKTRQGAGAYGNAAQEEADRIQGLMNQIDQALEGNKPEESYDGLYSMAGLEGKIAPTDLFEFDTTIGEVDPNILSQFDNLSNKAAKITRIKPEYCNVGGYNPKTGEFELEDTNYEINYEGITDTLVIPYEVTIDGEKYTITDVDISIVDAEHFWEDKQCYPFPSTETIVYPNTVSKVYYEYLENDFYVYWGPNEVVLSKNLLEIPDYFFYRTMLEDITIPASVERIGNYAFADSWLKNIFIPASVSNIGNAAFSSLGSNITIDSHNNTYMSENNSIYSKDKTLLVSVPYNLEEYIIPNTVKTIGACAFLECTSLKTVTIPNSVTSIGDSAFYRCTNLTNMTIPNSVTSIGDSAFYFCYNLSNITIPNSVISIGDSAFDCCMDLTNITIPSSVTSIGKQVFSNCSKLTNITVDNLNNNYSSEGGIVFNKDKTEIIVCPPAIKEVIIPDTVRTIGDSAFYSCRKTNITIPDSVTSIGDSAFSSCRDLRSITIPNSVTSIGDSAFYSCDNLSNITIPNSVTNIGNETFYYCDAFTNIIIPDSVISIGDSAFCACYNLTSITIPSSVTSIGKEVFSKCRKLTNIIVDDGNDYFTAENGILFNKSKTEIISYTAATGEYIVPDNITSIGAGAFSGCFGLTSITIPSSVTNIGENAFYDCSSLTITIQKPKGTIKGALWGAANSSTQIIWQPEE